MLNLLLSNPLIFLVTFGGLIISLSVHEFSHALIADRLGDPTPRMQGRVTLNPLAHLDPIGTILLLLTRFGWGKPVQFDPHNLQNPLRDSALIALAGPAANLLIAVAISLLIKTHVLTGGLLYLAGSEIFIINLVLAIFNLIPVYPLDGSKIILALLPRNLAYEYEAFINRYGFFVLLALIIPWYNGASPISYLVSPALDFFLKILM